MKRFPRRKDIMDAEMHYLSLVLSLLINERANGRWIKPQRGVRQGCLLVLPLFVLVVDALTTFTIQACS